MSHDAEQPMDPKHPRRETQEQRETSLLEILSLWATALAGVNHTLATVQDFLTALSQDQREDSKKLEDVRKSLVSVQLRLEQISTDIQVRCKEALKEFTKFKGAWGKLQWFLHEHQEHPKAVWSAFAMMVMAAALATALGLDVRSLFSRLTALIGWGPSS
jgi:hypothetical protein